MNVKVSKLDTHAHALYTIVWVEQFGNVVIKPVYQVAPLTCCPYFEIPGRGLIQGAAVLLLPLPLRLLLPLYYHNSVTNALPYLNTTITTTTTTTTTLMTPTAELCHCHHYKHYHRDRWSPPPQTPPSPPLSPSPSLSSCNGHNG